MIFQYIEKIQSLYDVPECQLCTRHLNFKKTEECRHGKGGAEKETNAALKGIRRICK